MLTAAAAHQATIPRFETMPMYAAAGRLCHIIVVFRSAKDRTFAERKATILGGCRIHRSVEMGDRVDKEHPQGDAADLLDGHQRGQPQQGWAVEHGQRLELAPALAG